MISSLELQNYRGFREYKLGGLARVNLLVGKNNSGKTSVLEAVHLLANEGDPREFAAIARQRGELVFVTDDEETSRRFGRTANMYPVIAHFFNGHGIRLGNSFVLNSDGGLGSLSVRLIDFADLDDPKSLAEALTDLPPAYAVRVARRTSSSTGVPSAFPVSEEGAISFERAIRSGRLARWAREKTPPVQLITVDSLDVSAMRSMWDTAVKLAREDEITCALQILEEDLASVHFLSAEGAVASSKGGVLLGFKDSKERLPLGSYGEGMRRLLALSLALVQTQNGFLLIDEFDTGLHYSIMGDIWRFVVQAAQRFGVQVFATTHSSDCVRGLAWLCENHPELGAEVSLQTIEPRLSESIALNAEKIVIAVEQGIEVR